MMIHLLLTVIVQVILSIRLYIELDSDNEDKYNPIKVNIALKNIIINHKDISPKLLIL